jgi:hypothetical protein
MGWGYIPHPIFHYEKGGIHMGVMYDSQGRGIDSENPLYVIVKSGSVIGSTTGEGVQRVTLEAVIKQQIEENTTPVGASATYTSASFDTMADGINYTWLTGHVFANQAGNLYIEQSSNDVAWERLDNISLVASTPSKINVEILSRYIRLVLVNGAVAQTTLRLSAFVSIK